MKLDYSDLKNISPRLFVNECLERCKLEECRGVCCSYGVWMDIGEKQRVIENAWLISPHLPEGRKNPLTWFTDEQEQDEFTDSGVVVHTRVVDDPSAPRGTTCIFRREDHLCALQVAAIAGGFHPWHFKPFYCVLHPLELDDKGVITLPDLMTILDEPASCLRPSNEPISLINTFAEELKYIMGKDAYLELLNQKSR